jgi:hypothetical protein
MKAPECRRPGCGHDAAAHPSYLPRGEKPGWCRACRCWQYTPERPWAVLLRRLLRHRRPQHAFAPSPPASLPERPVPCPAPGPEAYNGQTILDWVPSRARPYVRDPEAGGD